MDTKERLFQNALEALKLMGDMPNYDYISTIDRTGRTEATIRVPNRGIAQVKYYVLKVTEMR